MFYLGQEVVCVDDGENPLTDKVRAAGFHIIEGLDGLKKGQHYHVAGFEWDDVTEEECVILAEIKRPPCGDIEEGEDQGFAAWRFRPVQKKQTDISSLIALLNPANHKQLEDA